eukprot:scaffold54763_cov20-Tisochrysis_lutea.AAC.1
MVNSEVHAAEILVPPEDKLESRPLWDINAGNMQNTPMSRPQINPSVITAPNPFTARGSTSEVAQSLVCIPENICTVYCADAADLASKIQPVF